MGRLKLLFVANIPTLLCFSISGYLVIQSITGWGWFLFVGLLCTHTLTTEEDEAEEINGN